MGLLFSDYKTTNTQGLLLGKVINNYDKDHKGMVKVAINSCVEGLNTTSWMRVMVPMAGNQNGIYFFPDIGDQVIIGFINNDIDNPLIIGSLWSDKNDYPNDSYNKNNTIKKITTKKGIQIIFNDEDKKEAIEIETPKKLNIKINDENETIELTDTKGNIIKIDSKKEEISLKSKNKINIDSDEIIINGKKAVTINSSKITINGKNKTTVSGKSKVEIDGGQIEVSAKATLKLNASAIAELKGAMVKING